tara:strand:+ start:432 stop:797 length:366 start_codon:yes stop_codon:yes gene_type:complete
MAQKNYLYFAKEAPDGGAVEDVIMVKADSVSHFEMKDATKLHIFLTKGFSQEAQAAGVNNILVGITITSGKHKQVMEVLSSLFSTGNNAAGGFTVVADSENKVFIHPNITGCNVIEVVDAA